jgi:hypothetical protein
MNALTGFFKIRNIFVGKIETISVYSGSRAVQAKERL